MRSLKWFIASAVFLGLVPLMLGGIPLGGGNAFAEKQRPDDRQAEPDSGRKDSLARPVQPVMRAKLDSAKDILEGLTLEDHDKVAAAAEKLRSLSLDAGWSVIQTERYRFESEEFRRNCQSIVEAAKRKDTGRVAVGYIAMTVRCVECHDYIRNRQAQVK
ncbi:MAG: hypothetical protein AAF958_07715 [Planctomycetota bacterium]